MFDAAPAEPGHASGTMNPHTATGRLSLAAGAAVWTFLILGAAANLAYFYSRGLSNLYGDGIAHVEGARRIFDSLTPGYAEIGTVWLPLFHLLAAPLAQNDFLWRSGLAGSLVSSAAFVLTAVFLFRLAVGLNQSLGAGAVTLAGYFLCPNMLYLAATPLTEPLAQLWAVAAIFGLHRYQEGGRTGALVSSGLAVFLGTLTRYDGWYLIPFATLFVLLARKESWSARIRHALVFSFLAGLGPLLWLLHNAYRFGNAIEFYNGPFSAQAIYAHQLATTGFRYPTEGSLLAAGRYYLADLSLVIGVWPLALSALGLIAWLVDASERRRRAAALLLLVPLLFYLHSLAYAAVPLYIPTLFPNTYYNLRYGLEMLPALALLPSFLINRQFSKKINTLLTGTLLVLLAGQSVSNLAVGTKQLPLVQEGILNTPCQSKRQQAIIRFLRGRYAGGNVLVAVGKWPCVMPEVGIPFRKTLTEMNRKYWAKLLPAPENSVEWIIRGDADPVDELMRAHPHAFQEFEILKEKTFQGEGSVAIYRRRADERPGGTTPSTPKPSRRWPQS